MNVQGVASSCLHSAPVQIQNLAVFQGNQVESWLMEGKSVIVIVAFLIDVAIARTGLIPNRIQVGKT